MDKRLLYGLFLIGIAAMIFSLAFPPAADYTKDSSYFHERIISTIAQNGHISSIDAQSYQGRELTGLFIFHYFVAPFYALFGQSALHFITVLLLAGCIVLVGIITFDLTHSRKLSLIAAITAMFIPSLMQLTSETSPLLFTFFLFLSCIALFFRLPQHQYLYATTLTLFALTSPLSLIYALSFTAYLLISSHKKYLKRDREVYIFSTALIIWLQLIIYKKALFFHGISLIYSNLPQTYLPNVFFDQHILTLLTLVGFIPALLGAYAAYHYVSRAKREDIFLFSIVLVIITLLFARLLTAEQGIPLLGLVISILFAQGIGLLNTQLKALKSKTLSYALLTLIFIAFLATSVVPTLTLHKEPLLTTQEKTDLATLPLPQNATIMTTLDKAHAVAFITKRPVAADSNFLFVDNSDFVVQDIDNIYSSSFASQALPFLERYSATHILYFDEDVKKYGLNSYLDDCFKLISNTSIILYEVRCTTQ